MSVPWQAMLDVLGRCEALGPEACGLFNFGGSPSVGGIFVEAGRICWVAAVTLQQRLSHLIGEHALLRGVDLEAFHSRCAAENRPFGRALVEEKLISPEELEVALRRHSAESLIELCRASHSVAWVPRIGRGYESRFTFRPIDVLFDAVEIHFAEQRRTAEAELLALGGEKACGAAFLLETSGTSILPVAQVGGLCLTEVRTLGRWSQSLPQATREMCTAAEFSLAASADGRGLSVWWREPLHFTLLCESRASMATIVARHFTMTERAS